MNEHLLHSLRRMNSILLLCVAVSTSASAADGFGSNTTGGAGGASVTVTNVADLTTYATSSSPYVITVSGTLVVGGNVNVTSNKTIQGADTNATINGDLKLSGVSNVIIHHLNFTNPMSVAHPTGVGDGDGVTIINGTRNVFVTHCTFTDCADGNLDITNHSDSVTVSWCRFRYITQPSHRNVNLIGSSDGALTDIGTLHVTFHHNWWDQLCNERMPSVRYGRAHVYNNYYSSDSGKYGTRTRLYAECLVENNYFEKNQNPWELLTTNGTPSGKLRATSNNVGYLDTANGVTWVQGWYSDVGITQYLIPGTDSVFSPPYAYALDNARDVKGIVMASADNTGDVRGVRESPGTATAFALHQNYPNPFNPTTTIDFEVPRWGPVSLKVYDLLGREVATLVDGMETAGLHHAEFDGGKLSSGVYFARLNAGGSSASIRLVLAK